MQHIAKFHTDLGWVYDGNSLDWHEWYKKYVKDHYYPIIVCDPSYIPISDGLRRKRNETMNDIMANEDLRLFYESYDKTKPQGDGLRQQLARCDNPIKISKEETNDFNKTVDDFYSTERMPFFIPDPHLYNIDPNANKMEKSDYDLLKLKEVIADLKNQAKELDKLIEERDADRLLSARIKNHPRKKSFFDRLKFWK